MRQVLIIGAGPVGLTMAAELARYGVAVRIIDRAGKATQTSKALVVWSRTLELMDRMGCTQAFLDAGLRAHDATMRSGATVLGRVSFQSIASPYAFALMIPQAETERLLTAHLASFGVRIDREAELLDFTQEAGGVNAALRHADGREEQVATDWLIGCDGAHSTVRQRLHLEFKGHAEPDDWMLADVRLHGEQNPVSTGLANYLHRDGPLVIFPMPGGRVRIVASLSRTDPAQPRPDPALADVQALVDERAGQGLTVSDPVWLSNFRINERKVAQYQHGRVFLAGDAAHIHSPAGGQGMNTGMQDAINLAWKLAMVVHGAASVRLLASYSQERSEVGDMVLRNATRLTHMATLRNPVAQAARNLALRVLLGLHIADEGMAATMSETDIAYTTSPLTEGQDAGARLAPEHYDGPPPGAGEMPRFVIYSADLDKAAVLASRFGKLVERTARTPPAPGRMLIVRPDGYIGFLGDGAAWNAASRYLARLSEISSETAEAP